MEKLLTIKEVSLLMRGTGNRNRFVYDLFNQGKLRGAKFGNKILFKESDVDEFIEKQFKLQNKRASI